MPELPSTERQRLDHFAAVAMGALITRHGDPNGYEEARRICDVAWRIAKVMEACRLEEGEAEGE